MSVVTKESNPELYNALFLEDKIKEILLKDFNEILVKEFCTDWKEKRLYIELLVNATPFTNLLDHITNLQKELEHYKQLGLNQKQFEYENKIKILEHNCKQAEDSCRQHRLANKNKKRRLQRREEQINLYKTRIDKAIQILTGGAAAAAFTFIFIILS